MNAELKREGRKISMAQLRKILLKTSRDELFTASFDRFFMTNEIPENVARFGLTKIRVAKSVEDLKKTGKYLI
jgi:aryl carrier-like protein